MEDLFRLLNQLKLEVRQMKESVDALRKSRFDSVKDEWIDTTDVMNILQIGLRTVRSLRDNGSLPYSRVGRKIYYKLSSVEHILEMFHRSNLKDKGHGTE